MINNLRLGNYVRHVAGSPLYGKPDADGWIPIGGYGLYMLHSGVQWCEPIPLENDHLDRWDFDNEVWRRLRLYGDEDSYYVDLSVNHGHCVLTEYNPDGFGFAQQYAIATDLLKHDAGADLDKAGNGFLHKRSTMVLGIVRYVHDLQNLVDDLRAMSPQGVEFKM